MEDILRQLGVGIRPVNDPYFDDSYKFCKVFQRKGVTVDDEEELCHEAIKEFSCYIPGCNVTFQTLLDYEMHYNSTHRYVCTECKISRPNPRLLEIHIQETHDTFFNVLSQKQPMYQCYDSECDIIFNNPFERKEHCIKVHKYPKKYRFDNIPQHSKEDETNKMDIDHIVSEGKEKVSKFALNKNQKCKMFPKIVTNTIPTSTTNTEILVSTTTRSKITVPLAFVPRQVQKSFSKALTNNQNRERNVLESEGMLELAESLPD